MTEDELRVIVTAETDDYVKGMKKSRRETDLLGDTAENSSNRIMGTFRSLGKGIVALGIGKLLKDSVNFAGELEQNVGGAESVFKSYAGTIRDTAKTAYSSLGLAESDYLATATKMGALFQGTGMSAAKSADMTVKAMQRAADVASIMGIGIEEAMYSISGAAKGNFTMMDNLGVAINDTTLQIYAQEKGLGKLETTQQKVNAAMQMFMDKTEYAAGRYEAENNTYAGSLNTLKAEFKNFMTEAGTAIMPVVTTGIKNLGMALHDLSPIIVTVGNGIGFIGDTLALVPEPMMKNAVYGTALAISFAKMNKVFGVTGSRLMMIATLAMLVLGKLQEAATKSNEIVSGALDTATDGIEAAADAQDDLTDSVKETGKALNALAGFDEITKLSGGGSSGLSLVTDSDFTDLEDYSAEIEHVQSSFGELDNGAKIVFDNITKYWSDVFELIAAGDWENVWKKLGEGVDGFLTDLFGDGWTTIRNYWGDIFGLVESRDINAALGKVLGDMDTLLTTTFGDSWTDFSEFWEKIGAKIASGDIEGALTDFGKAFNQKFEEIFGDAGKEWNKFWGNVGAELRYQLSTDGKTRANKWNGEYRITYGELQQTAVDYLRQGKSIEEARELSITENLTTSEAMYWYQNIDKESALSEDKMLQWQANINSSSLTDPLTEEGVYNAVTAANASDNRNFEITTNTYLDGEKIGESVTNYQNGMVYRQNGR